MSQLLFTLARLGQIQGEVVNRVALAEAVDSAEKASNLPHVQLKTVSRHLRVKPAKWVKEPDPAAVPVLLYSEATGWGILRGLNGKQQWVAECFDQEAQKWNEVIVDSDIAFQIASLRLTPPYDASKSAVFRIIKGEFFAQKKPLFEAALGGVVINVIALATSFFTMQVYDRVVPTGARQTLLVLTIGVLAAVLFDLVAKHVRSGLYEHLIDQVDQRLSRSIYMRFLSIRLDQLPQSVGALASQLRGYETIRSFLTAATSQFLVDAPFAILFIGLIALISGWLALIPATFFVIALLVGFYYRGRVDALAGQTTVAGNQKTGLLVEAIEGAETIKSGQAGWRMLSRWMKTTDEARDCELQMRRIQEHSQHLTACFQQVSYVLLVASGALLVSRGELTMGGLIACSILSGRVLTPAAAIPSLLVQWANTKAALSSLDRLWQLQDDHHGCEQPLVPSAIAGNYRVEDAAVEYGGNTALDIKSLNITAGEKIGILGPIGGGKTTLLRMLTGMYKPQRGRVLLDDMELAHISKPMLSECIGYLQQDGRLFAGTLRDNLVLGMIDPGDSVILEAARTTGLLQAAITGHPKGLQQQIFEGGTGLSGGQRQLVNFTRVVLRRPSVWLLDEPTASMDGGLEARVKKGLREMLRPEDTLVLVTHKPDMLDLVDRVIVIANQRVVMDGPKQQVLSRLQAPSEASVPVPQIHAVKA